MKNAKHIGTLELFFFRIIMSFLTFILSSVILIINTNKESNIVWKILPYFIGIMSLLLFLIFI